MSGSKGRRSLIGSVSAVVLSDIIGVTDESTRGFDGEVWANKLKCEQNYHVMCGKSVYEMADLCSVEFPLLSENQDQAETMSAKNLKTHQPSPSTPTAPHGVFAEPHNLPVAVESRESKGTCLVRRFCPWSTASGSVVCFFVGFLMK